MNTEEKLKDCRHRLTVVLSDHQRLTHEALFNRKEIGMNGIRRLMQAGEQPPATFATALLYRELVREEYEVEFVDAWHTLIAVRSGSEVFDNDGNLITYRMACIDLLDAMADTIVTLQGLAEGLGFDLVGGYNEVMRSNLSKIMPDGKTHKLPNGKIAKPEGYSKPNLLPYIGNVE